MKDETSQISVAKNAGIACVVLLVIDLLVPFIAGPNKSLTIEIINLALYAGVSVTYVLLLRGLLPIAAERNDQQLLKDLNIFIFLTILTAAICAPLMMQSVISPTFQGAVLLISIIFMVALGVCSMRVAKGFGRLGRDYGKVAQRAALWAKVSGWMMASVVLLPIGVPLSLIAISTCGELCRKGLALSPWDRASCRVYAGDHKIREYLRSLSLAPSGGLAKPCNQTFKQVHLAS